MSLRAIAAMSDHGQDLSLHRSKSPGVTGNRGFAKFLSLARVQRGTGASRTPPDQARARAPGADSTNAPTSFRSSGRLRWSAGDDVGRSLSGRDGPVATGIWRRLQSGKLLLAEAISWVIEDSRMPLSARQVAHEIKLKDLYRRRDGQPPTEIQVARMLAGKPSGYWSVLRNGRRAYGAPYEKNFHYYVKSVLASQQWARGVIAHVSEANKPAVHDGFRFEMRFAFELMQAGYAPEYEHQTGVGNTSIDFRTCQDGITWLIELASIGESSAMRKTTMQDDDGWTLSLPGEDPGQSVEGETLRVQEKLCDKVLNGDEPAKFPMPGARQFHALVMDVRMFLGLGGGGRTFHYAQIAYGMRGLRPEERLAGFRWPRNRPEANFITGVFDPSSSRPRGASLLRERVHFLVFVNERRYGPGMLQRQMWHAANPALFATKEEVEKAWATFPARV
jgi:hypothetical protein